MKLRLAIQKKGRLREGSQELLHEIGIKFPTSTDQLIFESPKYPVEILFLRDDDIPAYVEQGIADAGIVGDHLLAENEKDVLTVKKLGFAKCRLSLAVAKNNPIKSIAELNGQKVATSYPNILNKYASSKKVSVVVQDISGSVEIAPAIDIAPAICDLVSSGTTLTQNGLKEIEVVLPSEAALITSKNLTAEKSAIIEMILFRLNAVLQAQEMRYVVLNAPKAKLEVIRSYLPGLKNPTITPLTDPEWCSFAAVVKEKDFWQVLENLKNAGAEGILVMPIEKIVN